MIVLVALVLGIVALFGVGTARVALSDLAVLETQDASQRAAEAAAARCADLIITGGSTEAQIDAAAQDEATSVAGVNAAHGSVANVTVTRTASATDLVDITVTIVVSYGGFAGPLQLSANGAAGVPRTGP